MAPDWERYRNHPTLRAEALKTIEKWPGITFTKLSKIMPGKPRVHSLEHSLDELINGPTRQRKLRVEVVGRAHHLFPTHCRQAERLFMIHAFWVPSRANLLGVLTGHGPMDVAGLTEASGLPLKTVQGALRALQGLGYVDVIAAKGRRKPTPRLRRYAVSKKAANFLTLDVLGRIQALKNATP